jgi:hypothetical protein
VNSANQCQCFPGYVQNINGPGCSLQCPAGYYFNFTLANCQPVVVPPNCQANMVVNSNNQCQCYAGYIPDPVNGGCRQQCSLGQFYNFTAQACQQIVCASGSQFNPSTGKCEVIVPVCPPGSFLSSSNTCVTCPAGYSYSAANNNCQATICPSGYVYNSTTGLCDAIVHVCPAGRVYSNVTNSCLVAYITSPQAGNLITANMANYTNYYNGMLAANPGIKDCTAPTPFFDPAVSKCATCPPAFPYFNLDTSQCMNCGGGSYDAATNSCVAAAATVYYGPTIGRFVSNVL